VFEEIAERITTNVRALEGALTRVVAAGSLSGQHITVELAARVLEQYAPQQSGPVTIERIQEVVCDHFALSREELLSDRRTRVLTHPRQVAMYLSRVLVGAASTRVGACFNRDHSTVLHAETRIEDLMKRDQEVHDLVAQLTAAVRGTSGGVQHAR
jgi:chromosomal replication initiator protein